MEGGKSASLQMGIREWLWLGALSIRWGFARLFVELALLDIPAQTVALGSTGIAPFPFRSWPLHSRRSVFQWHFLCDNDGGSSFFSAPCVRQLLCS